MFERQKMEYDYYSIFRNVGMGTTIWSPLASGLLTGKYNEGIPEGSRLSISNYAWLKDRMMQDDKLNRVKKLASVAAGLNTSLATLAVAWCIHNPNVTSAILGATKEQQLLENLAALDVYPNLTPDIMAQIDAIMGNKPPMP
jgi:aryl-alcohol dehydrogenase-like predicted oxidoreductase